MHGHPEACEGKKHACMRTAHDHALRACMIMFKYIEVFI